MASFVSTAKLPALYGTGRVQYECSCGKLRPIARIYFCRHCLKLRCKDCLSHEVDSQYCQHCLEYIPTIDAKLKKNKCSSCFSCPCCGHTLSTKALLSPAKVDAEPSTPVSGTKKSFYLICFYCKWTSRDANIPDQTTGTGGWPEAPTPNTKRLDGLFENYRMLAQKEKLEKEKKRINPRTGHAIHLLDKYGISASLSPKVRAQFYAKMSMSATSPTGSVPDLKSPGDTAPCEPATGDSCQDEYALSASYYEEELDLDTVATIEQRLSQVELQPERRVEFYPMSHMLSVKRSLRCKECDHNLSKPEYNPSSIKFKILLAAYYYVPEIRLQSVPVLEAGKTTTLELTLQNPSPYPLHVVLEDSDDQEDGSNCDISLPQTELLVPPRDDTLDIDALGDKSKAPVKDEQHQVTFRRGNKIGLSLPVTLRHDVLGPFRIAFRVKHDFVNNVASVPGSDKREPQLKWVTHKVMLNVTQQSEFEQA